jgi:hypothetical protein
MWIPIILICAAPYIESCKVITGLELLTSKEQCFKEVNEKTVFLLKNPSIYKAKPACQIIPEKVKEIKKGTDI